MDVGRYETAGFGEQRPDLHRIAFLDNGNGRRTDMLSERYDDLSGRRQRSNPLAGRQFVFRRMYASDAKCF
ncbi:hypothetical protein Barb7_02914 [Bacteroidales bacterium Barb7]|nr:hypothetical protein Barb7_02914 [Bacteroidales bacterium Barb7]